MNLQRFLLTDNSGGYIRSLIPLKRDELTNLKSFNRLRNDQLLENALLFLHDPFIVFFTLLNKMTNFQHFAIDLLSKSDLQYQKKNISKKEHAIPDISVLTCRFRVMAITIRL